MNHSPFEHLPISFHGQPILHINYPNVIFLHATCSIHVLVTLHTIRWSIFRPTVASVALSAHTIQKPIMAPLLVSVYDSTPSPTAISGPVIMYNLWRLCIQWCQNPDGRAAVGLCTCPAWHSSQHNNIALGDWRHVRLLQFDWMLPTEQCLQSVWYNW